MSKQVIRELEVAIRRGRRFQDDIATFLPEIPWAEADIASLIKRLEARLGQEKTS